MSHYPKFYDMLKSDKDDAQRAANLEAWLAIQPYEMRQSCNRRLKKLMDEYGLSGTGAKAFLYELILLVHDDVDTQDRKRAAGEAVRQAYEWSLVEQSRKLTSLRTPVILKGE